MNEPDLLDEPAPPPPKRRRRRLLRLGLVLLLLFSACGGFYGFLIYRTDKDLRDAMAEADRLDPDGWRLDDILAHRQEIPDEENAALVVQAVKAKLPVPWPTPRPLPISGPTGQVYVENDLNDLPPEVQMDAALLRDLRAELKAAAPALDEARKLYALRDGRFPLTFSKDYVSTIINSQDARAIASLLRQEAALLAQEGQADQALEATRGVLVTGRSVGDEPLTISTLIRLACDAQAVLSLERVLAQGEPSVGKLKSMQELLEAEEAEPLLLYSARGERAGMHQLVTAMKSGDLDLVKLSANTGAPGGGTAVADALGPTLARRSHARFLRLLTEYVEAAKLPPEEQAGPMKEVERKTKEAKVEYDVVIALLMPGILKVSNTSRRERANQRCALVGLAAERYRRDHGGRWPDTIAALVPAYLKAVPTDPFDGQPLRWKRLPDGIAIYSVGPDGKDDGGARNRSNWQAKDTDLVFRLWDPDQRRQPAAEVLPPPQE